MIKKIYKITRDSGADLKRLKILEKKGLIEINDVDIENITDKVKNKILPLGKWGSSPTKSRWDHCVWGDGEALNEIEDIVCEGNGNDAIILEAHLRSGNDYFVTNNPNDFVRKGRREKLESKFRGLKIVSVDELEKIIYE